MLLHYLQLISQRLVLHFELFVLFFQLEVQLGLVEKFLFEVVRFEDLLFEDFLEVFFLHK